MSLWHPYRHRYIINDSSSWINTWFLCTYSSVDISMYQHVVSLLLCILYILHTISICMYLCGYVCNVWHCMHPSHVCCICVCLYVVYLCTCMYCVYAILETCLRCFVLSCLMKLDFPTTACIAWERWEYPFTLNAVIFKLCVENGRNWSYYWTRAVRRSDMTGPLFCSEVSP